MKKRTLFSLINLALASATFVFTPAASAAPAATQSVPKAKGIWIDVRTPEEYAEGHISDAVNVPVDVIANKIESLVPNKNAPVNLYCKLGIRAEQARKILVAKGYTNVTNQGGYQDLLKKGIR